MAASTLYAWRRRLAQGDGDGRVRRRFGLVEVKIDDDQCAAKAGAGKLVVQLEGGRRIEVQGGFDSADLRRLIAVLESC